MAGRGLPALRGMKLISLARERWVRVNFVLKAPLGGGTHGPFLAMLQAAKIQFGGDHVFV